MICYDGRVYATQEDIVRQAPERCTSGRCMHYAVMIDSQPLCFDHLCTKWMDEGLLTFEDVIQTR